MTILGVHHINFLVSDFEHNTEFMKRLLKTEPELGKLGQRAVRTASFPIGNVTIVLVCPDDESSVVGNILKERGEGLFLISLQVDDLEKEISRLEHHSINMSEAGQRQGLKNWLVQDVNVPPALGPVFQLCQELNKPSSLEK